MQGAAKATQGALGTVVPTAAAAGGVAVALFAASSVKAALAFDQSFTRIAAISNSSADDIERWKGQVMSLAGETAQAPNELADALFFLSSAGLEASQVMPALEASAKAAAVGLGSTADVANIVASAMNAYSKEGLTAAQVTDTLVAAVREGRAEPDEFANALGRILPIASQAGVSFDQVTASLSALSNIGLDVNEGVTAMRGVLQAIVAPGTQAANAMAEIGLSAQDMLDAISERGLFGALQMLDQAAKANTNSQADYIGVLRQVVPNVRALTGVLGLTGQEAAKVDAIFNRVMNSTGSLSDAFSTVSQSASFQFAQALNDISIAGQKLATAVLPVLASAATLLADHFTELVSIATVLAASKIVTALVAWAAGLTAVSAAAAVTTAATDTTLAAATAAAVAEERLTQVRASASGASFAAATAERELAAARTAAAVAAEEEAAATATAAAAQEAEAAAASMGKFGTMLASTVGNPVFVATAGLALLAAGFMEARKQAEDARKTILGWAVDISSGTLAVSSLQFQIDQLAEGHPDFVADQLQEMADKAAALAEILRLLVPALEAFNNAIQSPLAAVAANITAQQTLIDNFKKSRDEINSMADAMKAAQQPIADFADTTGMSFDDAAEVATKMREAFDEAIEGGASDMKAFGIASGVMTQAFTENWNSIRDSITQALGGAGSAMAAFADKANVDLSNATGALNKYTGQVQTFGRNLESIQRDFGKRGEDFVRWASEQGLAQAGLVEAVAGANKQAAGEYIKSWNDAQGATDDLASSLADDLGGTLKDIRSILKSIAKSWHIGISDNGGAKKVNAAATTLAHTLGEVAGSFVARISQTGAEQANAAVVTFANTLSSIAKTFVANIQAHFLTGSPPANERVVTFLGDLHEIEDHTWTAKIDVNGIEKAARQSSRMLENVESELSSVIDALTSSIEGLEGAELRRAEELRDTWLDTSKELRRDAKELSAELSDAEDTMARIDEKAKEFGDDIRSAFDAFDLVGGVIDLGDQIKQAQIDVLQDALDAANDVGDEALAAQISAQIEALQDAIVVPTAEEMSAFLDEQLAQAQAFADALTQLSSMGLDTSLLQQFAAQGPAALPFMQALIDGGQDVIDQFNATQHAINQAANQTASALTFDAFGEELAEAAQALKDAQKDVRAFSREVDDFVDAMQADAVEAEVNDVIHALAKLANALDRAANGDPPNGPGNGNSPGATTVSQGMDERGPAINVTVNGDVSGEEVIRKVEEGLYRTQQRNGRLLFTTRG